MRSTNKRILALMLCVLMIMPSLGFTQSFSVEDVTNHWAKDQINAWLEKQLITGYPNGTFKPNDKINRAEFITIVNRAFGFTESSEISLTDVKETEWYYSEIGKAISKGYISGYDDGTIRPEKHITRQEVAVILCKILDLQIADELDVISAFKDVNDISDWSIKEVNAVVKKGFMNGYTDGSFKPQNSISRAEAVVVLDRAVNRNKLTILNEKGIHALGIVNGNVEITNEDIVLKDTVVQGDLIISESVGEGNVGLENVIVEGITDVRGGGENSIEVVDCKLGTLIIDKQNGRIRIVAKGNTIIEITILKSGATLEENELTNDGFTDVEIENSVPEGTEISISGNFRNVKIYSLRTKFKLQNGSIEYLEITENAEDSIITLSTGTEVITLVIKAKVEIKGKGKIKKAIIKTNGVRIEQKPDKVELDEGITAVIGYGVKKSSSSSSNNQTKSNNATLSEIRVNGDMIEGFNSKVTDYFIVLPVGTSEVPTITAKATDKNAVVEVTLPDSVPGTSTIEVTADDEKTLMIYRVNFAVSGGEPGENEPPKANKLPEQVIEIGKEVTLSPYYLATRGKTVKEANCENSGVVNVNPMLEDGLEISSIDKGKTTVTAVVYNDYGGVEVTFKVSVVKSIHQLTDEEIIEEVKESLSLSVQDAKGKNKTPKIALPFTDTLDYGTLITWETDNDEYITINENEAIIHRRGNEDEGGCGGHDEGDSSHSIVPMRITQIGINCGGDDGGHDDGGCSGSGGNTTIVELTATIKKGGKLGNKDFQVNIPWGWGKEITITTEEDEDNEEKHETEPPVAKNVPDQTLWINQFPLILTASDLASHGKTVKAAVYEAVYGETDIINLDILKDGRLQISPIHVGETTVVTSVYNELGRVKVEFNVEVKIPEDVTDVEAVDQAKEKLKLALYSKGNGPKQTNKITLPYTDMLGYQTDITWESDNSEFIEIVDGEAIIYRRGKDSKGGCGGHDSEDDSHSLSLMSIGGITINCGGDDGGDDGGGCGGGGDSGQGGKATVVKLIAAIKKGDEVQIKIFTVNIPWGWGKKITIK